MTRPNHQNPLAQIGPYELIEKVGAGGMGSVYRARDPRDGRIVALKLMHEHVASDPSYAERFRREAAVAALIDSPNVVRVLEFASDRGRPYIVTEFIEGPSVEDLVKDGPLPPAHAAAIAACVAAGLAAAAQHGVVHRDIKPANILIGADGVAKVTDFGIATLDHSSSLTMPGMFIGTAAYAAPEQHRGETDIRADIYSLGVVLFEMLTGSLPFQADTATGLMRKHEEAPVPIERLQGQPAVLVSAVQRCLEKSPGRRYNHPGELLTHLGAASAPVEQAGTVIAPLPAGSPTVVGVPEDPAATRMDEALRSTGQFAFPAPVVGAAALRERIASTPLFRKALVAGAVVTCFTVFAMVGFRGASGSGNNEQYSGGGGSGGIEVGIPPVLSSETPATAPTKEAPAPRTVTPLATPTAPATPSVSPTPTLAPPTVTPPPAPAPALYLYDYVFCHEAGCPYGDEELVTGWAIAVGFELSALTSLPVAAEIWFNGQYYYTSPFTPSSNGAYFDVLPFAYEAGELELRIYAGEYYLGSAWADVYWD